MRNFLRHLLMRLRRDRLDDELRDEMALHVELRTAELVERGMTPDEARAAALRRFGNTTLLREDSRTLWGFGALETVLQDIRYALRTMARARMLTGVVVVSLAIGIGVNAAIFSIANDVLFRKLPVASPDDLVLPSWVSSTKKLPGSLWGSLQDSDAGGFQSTSFTYSAYEAFRERKDLFTDLMAFKRLSGRTNVVADGEAELATAQVVSGNYYRGLGVAPALGRTITPDDDRSGSAAVVVLSYGYWQRRFGGRPDALGKNLDVNGVPATIVGVAPRDFTGTLGAGYAPELTLPLAKLADLLPDAGRLTSGNRWWIDMLGRLAPGVTRAQVESALAPAFAGILRELPKADPDTVRLVARSGARGLTNDRANLADQLAIMAMVAGLVLLIACANVANLLMSRAAARRREMAVRRAIGAGRGRLVRQLLTESGMLAGLGAAGGLVLAHWLTGALLASMQLDQTVPARTDWPVVGFTLAVSAACGILFGLAPALRGTRDDVTGSLKDGALGALGGRRRSRLAAGLLVTQMALAVLLSVGAGLLLRTVANLDRVTLGFDPSNLLVFDIDPTRAGYQGDRLRDLYSRLLDDLRALPGVSSATLSDMGLIAGSMSVTEIAVPGFEGTIDLDIGLGPTSKPAAFVQMVDPTFFETVRLPIRMGRALSPSDTSGTPRVVVVNEAMVRTFFHGHNPVGQPFTVGTGKDAAEVTIVGVAADMPFASLRGSVPPGFFTSYLQQPDLGGVTVEVRTATPPLGLVPAVRAAVRKLEPRLPIDGVRTEAQQIADSCREERTYATLATALGLVGVLLAAIGIYGLLAYQVARRTQELGLRMALGATRGAVARLVLTQSLRLAAAGAVLGLLASLAGTRVLAKVLFGLTATDPATFAGAILLLLAVALAAGALPARRAARVDPLVALRTE